MNVLEQIKRDKGYQATQIIQGKINNLINSKYEYVFDRINEIHNTIIGTVESKRNRLIKLQNELRDIDSELEQYNNLIWLDVRDLYPGVDDPFIERQALKILVGRIENEMADYENDNTIQPEFKWAEALIKESYLKKNKDNATKEKWPFVWTGQRKCDLKDIFNNFFLGSEFKTFPNMTRFICVEDKGVFSDFKPESVKGKGALPGNVIYRLQEAYNRKDEELRLD